MCNFQKIANRLKIQIRFLIRDFQKAIKDLEDNNFTVIIKQHSSS